MLKEQEHKIHFSNLVKLELTDNECIQCGIYVKVCPRAKYKTRIKTIMRGYL
ncbi:MAG: hypothetical protein PUA60_06610 [Methanobacteriaceae archaeon]|nr:hypothetical protein [Methanobacteriaceae archaeon]